MSKNKLLKDLGIIFVESRYKKSTISRQEELALQRWSGASAAVMAVKCKRRRINPVIHPLFYALVLVDFFLD